MSEKTENIIQTDENGAIHIAEEVVASIAALAAADVEGVAALSGGGMDIAEWLGRKNLSRGVKIALEDKRASVEIYLLVRYGYPVQTVARQVQTKVKDAIESMTGFAAGDIDVHVCGIAFDKSPKEKNAARTQKSREKQ